MKTSALLLSVSILVLLLAFSPVENSSSTKAKKGMIKVTILYPNEADANFNMDYYADKHMPMVQELLGDAMKGYAIDKGIAGRNAEEEMPYVAIGYLYFDKLSDYQEAFGPQAEKIVGDIPNYTNIKPLIQISEVVE